MKTKKDIAELFFKKCIPEDGSFIIDDAMPNPVFADKDDTPEERKRIKELNEKNWNTYMGIE